MLRIIICVFGLSKKHGGAELMAQEYAKKFCSKGDLVSLFTLGQVDSLIYRKMPDGYFQYTIPVCKIPLINRLLYQLYLLILSIKLKPDIIIEQGLTGWSLVTNLLLRTPYIVWGRGSDIYRFSGFVKQRYNPLLRFLGKLTLLKASRVFALSLDMKKQINQVIKKEVIVIPNGLNFKDVQSKSLDLTTRRYCDKQILFIGNVRPVKGVEYLIQAMHYIVKKEPNVLLVIIGDYAPSFSAKIPKHLRNNILLTGFIEHDSTYAYMKGSDVFVLPSISEGFPNVILEAMAFGLPIVATKVGANPELIVDGKNGFIVNRMDSHQLAEKVLLLLGDRNLRTYIMKKNLHKIREYDLDKVIGNIEKCVRDVIY